MSYCNSQKVTQISMKLLCCNLTMVILIFEKDMKLICTVLKMIMHSSKSSVSGISN